MQSISECLDIAKFADFREKLFMSRELSRGVSRDSYTFGIFFR